jgi:hypothetical protein
MLRLNSKITFTSKTDGTEIVFDFVNSVEIESSYENLTETAKITIPRKLNFDGKPIAVGLNSIFKRGDSVKIELGYFPDLRTVFNGYITKVSPKTPIVLECEDNMFILKQTIITKYSKTTVTLKQLLTDIIGTVVDFRTLLEVNLGSFKISNASVAQVLDTLKSDYGFYSYFVDGVLNVGLASDASDTQTIEFKFEESIIDDSSLEYQREEDMRLKVKAVSINSSDNSKTEVEVGDEDGALKTFHTQNATESALRKFAELKLAEWKYEGFSGSFKTFGEPYIRHGDACKLVSDKIPEKNGTYEVVSVKRSFNTEDGYKQDIEIGIKLNG